jgi:hypothetical protein
MAVHGCEGTFGEEDLVDGHEAAEDPVGAYGHCVVPLALDLVAVSLGAQAVVIDGQ